MFKLGFIGFGEAAYHISMGLKEEGLTEISAYDKYWKQMPASRLIVRRAEEAQVELLPSLEELVRSADIVASAVSADMATTLARQSKPALQQDKIYVDINAASPMTKEEVHSIIAESAQFVDCAVMGPVPNYRHKVPMLVSGDGAAAFSHKLTPYGMQITLMEAPAGAASASKMFRSIFMKGFVMLVMEMLTAAHRYRIADDVLKSVEETLTSAPLLDVINGLVCRGVIHSQRREHEMAEVLATLKHMQIDYIMTKATKEKLKWCTSLGLRAYFNETPPRDYHQILTALQEKADE